MLWKNEILPCALLVGMALIAPSFVSEAQDVSYIGTPDLSGYMPRSEANATVAQLQAMERVFLTDVTLGETATVAVVAGVRTVTAPTNCLANDRIFMTPAAALPAGVVPMVIRCVAAGGAVEVTANLPALALGANYSYTLRLTAFR